MNSAPASSDLLYFIERGSGPPLLLIHGLMVSGEMFETVREPFARRHRVIVPDLRGHGQSRTLPPPYTVAQLAADVVSVLDNLGLESAAVLGYSQGGAIAQQIALDHPRRCARLVLACTYAFNMFSFRETLEGHLAPLLIRTLTLKRFAKLVVSVGASEMGRERGEWLAGLMASQDPDLMLTAWKETMAFDSRRRLGEIRCPTLVVAGAKDNAVPAHHARMLHEGIAGSRLVMIEGASHALVWTYPDVFVRAVEEFLQSPVRA
jgi:3-oxoadipate enol-lactonase